MFICITVGKPEGVGLDKLKKSQMLRSATRHSVKAFLCIM